MTHPLTERQADQMTVEALRSLNLERANAAGPAVDPWPIGETRVVPSHRPELSDNHITRTSENRFVGFNTYQPSETVRELEQIRSELEHE